MKIALGLGCDRGTSTETLRTALFAALTTAHAEISNVAAVASIDLKADEPALHDLAREFGWTVRFYPAAELAAIASKLGRIPTVAEYHADMGVINADRDQVYRYMNFDQIGEYAEAVK